MSRGLVLISDIHYNLNNLKEADASLRQAFETAKKLNYRLVIAGDLNDTKAIIRAEVANSLLALFDEYMMDVTPIVLIGNHDLINEKGLDHSLNFLDGYAHIFSEPEEHLGIYYIPYQTSQDGFRAALANIPKGSTIICHQGFLGAFMGEYIQDKSSINPEELKDYKVYSGHYHRHQKIGTVTYIGTPYTTSFSEANDGPKGFLVIDENGREKQIETKLRKHTIVCRDHTNINVAEHGIKPNDLLWLKVSGPKDWLSTLNKEELGQRYIGHSNYRLDLIPTDQTSEIIKTASQTPTELLDSVIDATANSEERKANLKALVKELL